jgi:hypothetical protein
MRSTVRSTATAQFNDTAVPEWPTFEVPLSDSTETELSPKVSNKINYNYVFVVGNGRIKNN